MHLNFVLGGAHHHALEVGGVLPNGHVSLRNQPIVGCLHRGDVELRLTAEVIEHQAFRNLRRGGNLVSFGVLVAVARKNANRGG